MTDDEYRYLVDSHGDAVPPRDRIRLHHNQVAALDSLLRVMRELGIDNEARITAIRSRISGITRIERDYSDTVVGNRLFELEMCLRVFEVRFMQIALGEFDDD